MTNYDWYKTNPDVDYAGHRTWDTDDEIELQELKEKEARLASELEDVREWIEDLERKLGL